MSERRWLIAIIALSVVLRVTVALYLGDTVPPAKDEQSYSLLAGRLAEGYGYSFAEPWYLFATPAGSPTSHWSFLYTAFVAGIDVLFGLTRSPRADPGDLRRRAAARAHVSTGKTIED